MKLCDAMNKSLVGWQAIRISKTVALPIRAINVKDLKNTATVPHLET